MARRTRSGEHRAAARRGAERGFTYLALLFAVAISGVLLAAAGTVWQTAMQRERELELLFVGAEIERAITLYFETSPGPVRELPRTLADLVEDRRGPVVRRHLRRLYRDPITGGDWGIVPAPGGRIAGVYSRSDRTPLMLPHRLPDRRVPGGAATRNPLLVKPADGLRPGMAGTARKTAEADTGARERTGMVAPPRYNEWIFGYNLASIAAPQRPAPAGGAPAPAPPALAPTLIEAQAGVPVPPGLPLPGAAVTPPAVAPAPPPAETPRREPRPECAMQRNEDMSQCWKIAKPAGAAAFQRCAMSASLRESACQAGRAPMPLLLP
jgi:type II secretory pathway pseudopilin PulG